MRPTALRLRLICWLALTASPLAWAGPAQLEAALHVTPTDVPVDLFCTGTVVQIDGLVPDNCDVAVVCRGAEQRVALKKKSKVCGCLWVNTGEVEIDHVPCFHATVTSKPAASLAPPEVLEELRIGAGAMGGCCGCGSKTCKGGQSCPVCAELIKLKQTEKLFSVTEGGVKVEPQPGGRTWISAQCCLPANAPPGDYEVLLFGFSNGQGVLLARKSLRVHPAGAAALIASLSREHGLLYGIGCSIIALAAGCLTGFVFGRGGRH